MGVAALRNMFFIPFLFISSVLVSANINFKKTLVWGPGLDPANIVLPARYFFLQFVDENNQNITIDTGDNLTANIRHYDKNQYCRVWTNVLNRHDGSYIIRYKVYQTCNGLSITLQYKNHTIPGFPITIQQPVLQDECYCPQNIGDWMKNLHCPATYQQIESDLSPFESVNMKVEREKIKRKFNKHGSMSICHYVIISNKIFRKCYGQYVGFHVFMDATLLSLARKVVLPDLEFFVNLGDWPLEVNGPNPLPIFSWCGSDITADIVMPTYDLTESTLQCMGRVQLDMLSVQGNTGPSWDMKTTQAFWRGRDSRLERLQLIDIARKFPHLFNASLTNFFFFRDKEAEYGPRQPHVSFFDFFEYKYQLCIDGTVASYRMPYLIAGDSLVLKQDSPYYEHFYKSLQAGVHFLPIARNLSNLVEQIEWAMKHDEAAQRIGNQGKLFARENLMPTHIFCYYARLFQEWGRRLSSSVEYLDEMDEVTQPVVDSKCECRPRHLEL